MSDWFKEEISFQSRFFSEKMSLLIGSLTLLFSSTGTSLWSKARSISSCFRPDTGLFLIFKKSTNWSFFSDLISLVERTPDRLDLDISLLFWNFFSFFFNVYNNCDQTLKSALLRPRQHGTFKIARNLSKKFRQCFMRYRDSPLWSTHGMGRPTGPRGGAHHKRVQCPSPAETIGSASRTLTHTCALSAFCGQL